MVNITPAFCLFFLLFWKEDGMEEEKIIIKTDGEIDLVLAKGLEEYSNCFDIYLHDTDINIGNIWCDDKIHEDINYLGNVGYHIYQGYEGKGYALKALKLIRLIMKEKGASTILLNIEPNNVKSRRVAEKFGAKLLCYRPFPEKHELYDFSRFNKVAVYVYNIGEEDEDKKRKSI